MKIFPIKKLPLISILVAVILAIGLILFVGAYSKKGAFSKINIFGARETVIESQNIDTDNDGLKDWEENLYNTDPLNPDTDGDGYLDGEEVNSGHNPLVKAPGDKLGFHPLPLGEKYNITKKIFNQEAIRELLISYFYQKSDYIENHPEIQNPEQFFALTDPSTIKEIAKRAIWDSYDLLMQGGENIYELIEIFEITISDDQIKISEDNSKQIIELYISKISDWLNSDIFFFHDEALQIINNAFESQDFSELDEIIKLNDTWVNRMKEITVPSSWKEIHKQGFETIILFRNILVSLRAYEDDPFKAYYAADKLEEISDSWTELVKKALDLAEKQGIELAL